MILVAIFEQFYEFYDKIDRFATKSKKKKKKIGGGERKRKEKMEGDGKKGSVSPGFFTIYRVNRYTIGCPFGASLLYAVRKT